MNPFSLSLLAVIFLASFSLARAQSGHGRITLSGELKQWHKVTLTLDGPLASGSDNEPNPFTDLAFNVTFTHESGTPSYKVPGHLAADGCAAETSADHGFHIGEQQRCNQSTLFERNGRSPLIIAGPGMKGGRTTRSRVELIDLYLTVAGFCGLKTTPGAAGATLRPIVAGPTAGIKDAVFTLITRGEKLHVQSIHTALWRFTRGSEGVTGLRNRVRPDCPTRGRA
jgi:hypothetical protein